MSIRAAHAATKITVGRCRWWGLHKFGVPIKMISLSTVEKSNGKPGRGDLVVKDDHLGGFRDLVVDVVCTHKFGGNHLADVSLNCQLRDHDPTGSWRTRHAKR